MQSKNYIFGHFGVMLMEHPSGILNFKITDQHKHRTALLDGDRYFIQSEDNKSWKMPVICNGVPEEWECSSPQMLLITDYIPVDLMIYDVFKQSHQLIPKEAINKKIARQFCDELKWSNLISLALAHNFKDLAPQSLLPLMPLPVLNDDWLVLIKIAPGMLARRQESRLREFVSIEKVSLKRKV